MYIQIWSEQKHAKPDPVASKISTKEYFDRQKEMSSNLIIGKEIINNVIFLTFFKKDKLSLKIISYFNSQLIQKNKD